MTAVNFDCMDSIPFDNIAVNGSGISLHRYLWKTTSEQPLIPAGDSDIVQLSVLCPTLLTHIDNL